MNVGRAASDIAERAINASTANALMSGVLESLQRFVGWEQGGLGYALPGVDWVVEAQHISQDLLSRNAWRYITELPVVTTRAMARGFARDADITDTRVRDRASVYREIIRPLGVRAACSRVWACDNRATIVSLMRSRGTFRDAEIKALDELYCHTRAALRLAAKLERSDDRAIARFLSDYAIPERQAQVVRLVLRGLQNREIAVLTGLSTNTVRNYLANVFRRTRCSNRAELVYLALTHSSGNRPEATAHRQYVVFLHGLDPLLPAT